MLVQYRRGLEKEYIVPSLEGLWWAKEMTAFTSGNKDDWDWTMMIMQPDWISSEMFDQVCTQVQKAESKEVAFFMKPSNFVDKVTNLT